MFHCHVRLDVPRVLAAPTEPMRPHLAVDTHSQEGLHTPPKDVRLYLRHDDWGGVPKDRVHHARFVCVNACSCLHLQRIDCLAWRHMTSGLASLRIASSPVLN